MILGKRIRLRAIEREDLPHFVAWLNDPEVRQHMELYIPLSIPQEEDWFENTRKGSLEEQPLVIELDTGEGWKAIGNTAFIDINWRDRLAEVSIFIGEKRFWNKGYGSETTRLMLEHGFNNLNLNRIFLRVYETNPRGIRAYEKVGFVHEGRMRQARFQNGKFIDVLIMSILNSEWKNKLE